MREEYKDSKKKLDKYSVSASVSSKVNGGCKLTLHESEINLLELIREVKFGEVKIKVQDGLPAYYTEIQRSEKLI